MTTLSNQSRSRCKDLCDSLADLISSHSIDLLSIGSVQDLVECADLRRNKQKRIYKHFVKSPNILELINLIYILDGFFESIGLSLQGSEHRVFKGALSDG